MANNWDEFFTTPIKASKKLHVTAKDVKRGAQIDARRREAERLVAEQSKTTPTGLPYGTTPRPSGVPSDAPSLYAGELAKSAPSDLISNALLAGNLGGVSAAFGALAPLRTGLAVGAGADAVLGAKAGEGDIPAVLSGAGMLGRRALPMALATGAAYAADAEAMPFVKYLKYLKNNKGEVGATPLFKNPTTSEIGELWKSAREDSFTNDITPTLRIMRDLQTPDTVYAWDGTKLLHKDVADQLGLPFESLTGTALERGQNTEEMIKYFQGLRPGAKFAGGGLVKSGLKMMFPNLGAPLHVVKPKGGNWLSGSVENALRGLKKNTFPIDHPLPDEVTRLRQVPGEDGTTLFQDPLRGNVFTPEQVANTNAISTRQGTLNSWIEGPLTKYVKTRMASPDDEVRRLADEGVLHVDPAQLTRGSQQVHPSGEYYEKLAHTPGALRWENAADQAVIPTEARSFLSSRNWQTGVPTIETNPWLSKVPTESMVYDLAADMKVEQLGFDHLVDELRNALDPNSGLPRHLQLTPEAVKNLSMEKAVRRVADINAWRAAQIAEANGKIAGGPGQELVREYAENNPKGLRWVELKKQTGDKLSDAQLVKAMEERGMYPEEIEAALKDPAQRAQIEEQAFSDVGALADQLRYEGDTMGHCVGGYCDDVISGRSRIFSLRDAKGEPHVTVEVEPQHLQDPSTYMTPEEREAGMQFVNEDKKGSWRDYFDSIPDLYNRIPPKITQIKGKQNRKPNDEYLPFVQDFVKNPPHGAPWGGVGDLHNTDLRRIIDAFNSNELTKIQEAGIEVPQWATQEEINEIGKQVWPNYGRRSLNFASGGSVGVPAAGWELLTDPTGSPMENKLSWDIFSGHNDAEQLEALE